MNAEYTSAGKTVQFTVTPDDGGHPPRTAKINERSTCGKYILEHILVIDYFDVTREIAIYSLMGTGRRAV
jgi:hypothetical protein